MSFVYALDTNILSFFLREDKTVTTRIRNILLAGHTLIIPPIVYYEVRRGLLVKDARKQTVAFNNFCKHIPIGKITVSMLDEAAGIYAGQRGSRQTIGDADTLIAAFCIANDYTLITKNTKHFSHIQGLKLADWTY